MKTVFLIRHSKPLNSNNLLFDNVINKQEQNEKIPLSKEGEELAYKMALNYFNGNINYLWSSSYERTISTAKYIALLNNISINISTLFNERKLGDTTNLNKEFWLTQLQDESAKAPNGESQFEVRLRMLKGLYNILDNIEGNSKVAIVTHATALTFLLMNWCELKKATLEGKKRWITFNNKDVINGSLSTPEIFRLDFDDNKLIDITRVLIKE